MVKLLIVDDEPLVQIGIKSMLDWQSLGIEVAGTASNGAQALDLIEEHRPDIILCDIKMPVMTGLELIEICRERYTKLPIFIFLTSYEEFPLVKEAIKYEALDYLIKLDLTPEILMETIQKALKKVYQYKNSDSQSPTTYFQFFYERFMIRLLNNLFDDRTQFEIQAKELKLDFSTGDYTVCFCTLLDIENSHLGQEKLLGLYLSTTQMIENIIQKHLPCFMVTLGPKHFCIILKTEESNEKALSKMILKALKAAFEMVDNYFNVKVRASVGLPYEDPLNISDSYQEARQIHSLDTQDSSIMFYSDYYKSRSDFPRTTFNLGVFKNNIKLAFESFDAESLEEILDDLIHLFTTHPNMYLQAIDAACNILYLTLSLLPNSKESLNQIFQDETDGYRSIYKKTQIDQVIKWLEEFKTGVSHLLRSQQKNYKNYMIKDIQDYIDLNIDEKLTLNDIASLFGITPNYLSTLFKKTTDIGFSEYITSKKIAKARVLLLESDIKVYEVADQLGFDSAFYFSKVFKKNVGLSPREFIQKSI